MRTLTATALKSKVKELLFVISPAEGISSDVRVLKDDVHYLTGKTFEGHGAKAHISLFPYLGDNSENIIRQVEEQAMNFSSFEIIIKDFGVFHHGNNRTIYMDIVNKYRLRDIFESITGSERSFTPHLTIARNLPAEDFLMCWPYFKELHYSQHFSCDRITVLAKKGKRWVHYKDILLGV